MLATPTLKNQDLYAQIQTWTDQLKLDPNNTALRTKIIKTNVDLTAVQLGTTTQEAGNIVRSYTAAYATSTKIDPKALMDSLTKEEQNILNYSASNPTLYGMSLTSANTLASYLGIGSGVLLMAALTVFTVALFTVGPEVAATIGAGEGVVATIGAALGEPLIAAGGFLFLLSQFLGHLSSGIPMMTKQMIDNGSIGPGLRISALKDAEDAKAKLSGSVSPGSFTGSQFSDYATAIETQGLAFINDPCKAGQVAYTRDALADLVKCIYGKQATTGGATTVTKIIPILAPYLIKSNGKAGITATLSTATSGATTVSTPVTTSTPTTKVFTGIVSQGVVQQGLTFTPRPDDLIESVDELKTAATNNLAPFLQSLPGKVIYEIKIVSSITTANGFKQTGTTQKIQTGKTKAGAPIYKTVTNKFATLILYIMNDKNTKSKITTINLGPVDSAKLTVSQNDLTSLQTALPAIVTTTNISDITHIVSTTPVQTITQQGAPVVAQVTARLGSTQYFKQNVQNRTDYLAHEWNGSVMSPEILITKEEYISGLQANIQVAKNFIATYDTTSPYNIVPKDKTNWNGQAYFGLIYDQKYIDGLQADLTAVQNGTGIYATGYNSGNFIKFQAYAPMPSEQYLTQNIFNALPSSEQSRLKALYNPYSFALDTAPVVSTNATQISQSTSSQKPGANATTLSEWYQAQGQTLPNVEARSKTYESLGLGQASYYVGSAEQNTKLLNALAGRA